MRREARRRTIPEHRFLNSPVVATASLGLALLAVVLALVEHSQRTRRQAAASGPTPDAVAGPAAAASSVLHLDPPAPAGPGPGARSAASAPGESGLLVLDPEQYRDGASPPGAAPEIQPADSGLRVLTAVTPEGLGDDRPPLNPGALWQLDPDAERAAPQDALQALPVSALYDRATGAILSRDIERAARYLRIAREKDPEDPTVAAWLGLVLADLEQFAEAEPLLEQAVREQVAVEACSIQLARAAAARGDRARACQILAGLIAANPLVAELYHDLAVLLASSGDLTGAIHNMRAFLRLRPADRLARERLVEWLQGAGRVEEVASEIETLAAACADSDPALARYGLALIQAKRYGAAIALLERHLAAAPREDLPALRFLSAALLRSRDLDRAIAALKTALERHPDDFVLRFNLACGLSLNAQPGAALEQLQVLARNAPTLLAGTLDDPDLAAVREDPAGAAWVAEFRGRHPVPEAPPAPVEAAPALPATPS